MNSADVVIVGGGIVGLSAALEIASQGADASGDGLKVAVLERGRVMQEASWAAAGMLAAEDPENPRELAELSRWSASLYPEFLERVERLSGRRIPLRTQEAVQAVEDSHGCARPWLTEDQLAALIPGLAPAAPGRGFVAIPEYSLDPRDLCAALPLAAQAAGVRILEDSPVTEMALAGQQLALQTSAGEVWTTPTVVLCTGAWTGELTGKLKGTLAQTFGDHLLASRAPVEPRKGQMLAVQMPEGSPVLERVIRTPELYLVPRGQGRIIIGATVEHAGFDRTVREEATEWLLAEAARLWPPIAQATVAESWTGLRPATRDSLPVLGELYSGGQARCFIATGHFRNGILLAPATAKLIQGWVSGRKPSLDLQPFAPGRWTAPETEIAATSR